MPNGQVKIGLFENNKFNGAQLVTQKLLGIVKEENFGSISDNYLSKPPDIPIKLEDDVLS